MRWTRRTEKTRGENEREGEGEKKDGGKREGARWVGREGRRCEMWVEGDGGGWAKGDDYCGGGLLICIRKTKGVGRAVCMYACVCLPLISRNEGRREADQKSFPAFFVVPRLNRASLCSRF